MGANLECENNGVGKPYLHAFLVRQLKKGEEGEGDM